MSKLFELASRKPLRFRTEKNSGLTVEDLWTLPLTKLNEAAKDIHTRLIAAENTNFLKEDRPANPTDTLMIDVVKHIITVKQSENALKTEAKVKATRNAMIDDLIQSKEDDKLKEMSVEELVKLKDA